MKATPDLSNPVIQEYNRRYKEDSRKKREKLLHKIALIASTVGFSALLTYTAIITSAAEEGLKLVYPEDSYGVTYEK